MLTRAITSLQHPIVKKIIKLKSQAKYRDELKLFVLATDKIIQEAATYDEIETLLYLENSTFHLQLKAKEKIEVSCDVLDKCLGYHSSDTCLAIFKIRPPKLNLLFPWLILDQVQDPGNLGTLLRSALAFGFKTIILTKGSCDIYNDKAIKSSRGANFHLEIHECSSDEFLALAKERKASLFFADAKGENIEKISFSPQTAIILGNEGHGVSLEIRSQSKPIAILMEKEVESLNVAIAGSIIMHQVKTKSL